MFSLFNGRKDYYDYGAKKEDPPTTKMEEAGIEDSGIVVDHRQIQVPVSPFGTNSYEVTDEAKSELSSSAYGSGSLQPDTPSNDEPILQQQQQQQKQPSKETMPKQKQQRKSKNVHAISYVTQALEHGYEPGYEDDLSTLGDESIIRRGKQNQLKQQELRKKQLEHEQQQQQQQQQQLQKQKNKNKNKNKPPKQKYDKTKISQAHTRSTEELSPQSNDLSFSFSNVMDENEKMPDSSRLGYEITDDSLTDKGKDVDFGDGNSKKEGDSFIDRNKWAIIKFMVIISLFLLMTAAAVLVVSLLHMRSIVSETEAWTMENGNYRDDASDFTERSPVAPFRPSPTKEPTQSPTSDPTSSPPTSYPTTVDIVNSLTDAERAKVGTDLKFVIANFSPSSLPLLDDPNSAQTKAFNWMTKDPDYWNMEISRIVQRWTLAVLYYSTGGPNWKTENFPETYAEGKSPWLTYSDECLWESTNQDTQGLICDSQKNLFGIHLRGVGLTGSLPAELSLLSNHMRLLFFNGNQLTGTLPSELGRLTALEKLNLQYNNFTGNLPSEIGQWGLLTIASLGNNRFSGQIPLETGSWGSMQTIDFRNNQFYGTLPSELSNLPYLETISLEGNFLTGTIPYEFNFMYQLTSLKVQSNDLSGDMPWGLCPGCYSVLELEADCQQVFCDCCTMCYRE